MIIKLISTILTVLILAKGAKQFFDSCRYAPSANVAAPVELSPREIKRMEQERKKQKEKNTARKIASSRLEYINHRCDQLQTLMDYTLDKQEGTTRFSKEFYKYEKDLMKYESQYQTLKERSMKAWATLEDD